MSSPRDIIHIAIPNSVAMLCDPAINLDDLRVSYIEGIYTENINRMQLEDTPYSRRWQEVQTLKFIHWGKKWKKDKFGKVTETPLAYDECHTLRRIYESEGNFTITELLVEFPYTAEVEEGGVKRKVQKIAYHTFRKWNFSPRLMAKILNRVPSHPLYLDLKRNVAAWKRRSGNVAAANRIHSTWLVNRPIENLPMHVYELWYGKGALIIPEKSSDFKGRELGLGFNPKS